MHITQKIYKKILYIGDISNKSNGKSTKRKDIRRGVILAMGLLVEKPEPSSVTTRMKTEGKDISERRRVLLIMKTS